jgi:hypothetical protein
MPLTLHIMSPHSALQQELQIYENIYSLIILSNGSLCMMIPRFQLLLLQLYLQFRNSKMRQLLEHPEYSKSAFADAIVEFVVGDDQVCIFQAVNVVKSPCFKKILLLLHAEPKESDIPSHSTIHNLIEKHYEAHMKQLEEEMMVFNTFDIKLSSTDCKTEISWKNIIYN